ncbi:Scr1 family TA system antitoxin-like transcriptional regulator, partial [Actinomadura meridiana]|uniref:Scr1 family TA system antitoxin-like transcriptional regulator n=1 Tax=Actinomadura meridiana TaxID=559626 RepID=UPI0031E9C266
EGGLRKRANRKVGTAPQPDPYKIEADAAVLVCWRNSVIPGLAQTPEYALAIVRGNQETADVRIKRQAILTRDDERGPAIVVFLIEEQVLHHKVGTNETMKRQLEHLIESSACCPTSRFK